MARQYTRMFVYIQMGVGRRDRQWLLDVLGPLAVAIEHVGSTAVRGLAAKPIIDLMVGVRGLSEARSCCIAPLRSLGYDYLPQYASWLPGELFFRRALAGAW